MSGISTQSSLGGRLIFLNNLGCHCHSYSSWLVDNVWQQNTAQADFQAVYIKNIKNSSISKSIGYSSWSVRYRLAQLGTASLVKVLTVKMEDLIEVS
jgi:hypothetical protein